ncbi:MAG: hypothetical protein VW618_04430 [Alphaproteobacteria bacterium]
MPTATNIAAKITALLQQVFYPRTDSPNAAARAVRNGAVAGWIMVAVHFVLGAVLIILIVAEQERVSGDALIPATIQLFVAFAYGALATYAWRASRGAIVTMLILLVLDTLLVMARVRGLDPQFAVHLIALILALGGARGAFAHAAHQRKTDA